MRRLREILLVAGFDLMESLRARKVLVLFALYVAGAAAATGGFVAVLAKLEHTINEALKVADTSKPGAMTEALMMNEQLREGLGELVGDQALANELVLIPLIALFYSWLAFTFVPALVTFTSCDAIANEVSSGSCRFALVRTDRLGWALGKAGGQAALLGVGIAGGAFAAWLIGLGFMNGFDALGTAWWLARLALRAWLNGLPYLGLALGCSLVVRSPNAARALAMFALIGVGVVDSMLAIPELNEYAPVLLPTLRQLLPGSHTLDLWRPALIDRLPSLVLQPALGAAFFLLGYARFNRRDA